MPKIIEHRHLETDTLMDEHHADVSPGQSIRIFGTHMGTERVHSFDLAFAVGDMAVYDGYTFIRTGEIVDISSRRVWIKPQHGTNNVQIPIARFIELNWDYDAARIERHNEIVGQGL